MLEALGLRCVRGDKTLFAGLNARVRPGELLRVAGANGSGKTSLLRMLCGLVTPTEGEVRWRGQHIRELHEAYFAELLYIGHATAVKDELSAAENLAAACAVAGVAAGVDETRAALRAFGLAGCEDLAARVLSQGQRRRVALARLALSAGTALWILDEPFTALDPAATRQVAALIAAHIARGALVIYTTHQDVPIDAPARQRIDLDERAPGGANCRAAGGANCRAAGGANC